MDSIQQLCMSLLGVVSAPIRIIGALYLLHAQLGAAAWVTLGLLAALMPLQVPGGGGGGWGFGGLGLGLWVGGGGCSACCAACSCK